jgi:Staphylococcal nuclease homologue
MNLNQELVKQGWCWWYRKYAPENTVLEGLETEAREAKIGLWADPQHSVLCPVHEYLPALLNHLICGHPTTRFLMPRF